MLNIKRIYDAPAWGDGYRILVDRLWPRGISKERARLSEWAKDIAPSNELRQEFGHDPEKFDWFQRAYVNELNKNAATRDFIGAVKSLLSKGNVTLLYGARDPKINQAVVLKEYVGKRLK